MSGSTSSAASQTKALETLDANRRVVVLGRAGTGKTRLAMAWARRAGGTTNGSCSPATTSRSPSRSRRTCLRTTNSSSGRSCGWRSGSTGCRRSTSPRTAGHDWWTVTAVGHLHAHWHLDHRRGSTRSSWTRPRTSAPPGSPSSPPCCDPEGPRRLLIAADPDQERLPARASRSRRSTTAGRTASSSTTAATPTRSARSSDGVSAGQRLPESGPRGDRRPVRHDRRRRFGGLARGRRDRRASMLDGERDSEQIAVLTTTSRLRDALVERLALRRWEDSATTGSSARTSTG